MWYVILNITLTQLEFEMIYICGVSMLVAKYMSNDGPKHRLCYHGLHTQVQWLKFNPNLWLWLWLCIKIFHLKIALCYKCWNSELVCHGLLVISLNLINSIYCRWHYSISIEHLETDIFTAGMTKNVPNVQCEFVRCFIFVIVLLSNQNKTF